MPTEEVPVPTREIPYVGPTPFQRADQALFFGRRHEANELLSLITAHPVVLLYSQSGAGKTSLLNASLIPMLKADGFDVAGPARVRPKVAEGFDYGEANPYVFNALVSLGDDAAGASLDDYLRETFPTDEAGRLARPCVLIFDQFEELFTLSPEFWGRRREFFEQVARALSDPLLRVLFAMREDFIAELDPYEPLLPEKLRTRFRIERLREGAALEAIKGPLGVEPWKRMGRTFAPSVAERLVRNLREIPSKTDAQGQPALAEFVEPVQLQIVCLAIWKRLRPQDTEITGRHLEEFGNINEALTTFYEGCVSDAVEAANSARRAGEPELHEGTLRAWFDSVLITETGKRGIVLRTRHDTGGIPNAAVDALEAKFIVRAEVRGGDRWYELSHDRFLQPIKESYKKWLLDRPGAEQTMLRLEEKARAWSKVKDASLLLNAGEVLEARRWLDSPEAAGVTTSDRLRAFVGESEAAIRRAEAERIRAEQERERELAAARLSRARLWKYGTAALALLLLAATGAAAYAIRQTRFASEQQRVAEREKVVAQEQTAVAELERKKADSASTEAMAAQMNALEQQRQAEIERDRAVQATKAAQAERQRADKERAEAERARDAARSAAAKEQSQRKRMEEAVKVAEEQRALAVEAGRLEAAARERERLLGIQKDAQVAQDNLRYESKIQELATKLADAEDGKGKAEAQVKIVETLLESTKKERDVAQAEMKTLVESLRGARTMAQLKTLQAKYPAGDTPGNDPADIIAQGLYSEVSGNLAEAAERYGRALSLYERADDFRGQGEVHQKLARLSMRRGDYAEALKSYEDALKAFRKVGDVEAQESQADIYDMIRAALRTQAVETGEDLDDVVEGLEKVLAFYAGLNSRRGQEGQAATHDAIGDVHLTGGTARDYEEAAKSFGAALGIYSGLGMKEGTAQMHFNIGFAHQAQGNLLLKEQGLEAARPSYDKAVPEYEASLSGWQDIGQREKQIAVFNNLGEIYRSLQLTDKASEYFARALKLQQGQPQQQQQRP